MGHLLSALLFISLFTKVQPLLTPRPVGLEALGSSLLLLLSTDETITMQDRNPGLSERTTTSFSLAGPYLIAMSKRSNVNDLGDQNEVVAECAMYPLSGLKSRIDPAFRHSEGAVAWSCLNQGQELVGALQDRRQVIKIVLPPTSDEEHQTQLLNVEWENGPNPEKEPETASLWAILSRLLVQFYILEANPKSRNGREWTIAWANDGDPVCKISSTDDDATTLEVLFRGICKAVPGETELVEMVNQQGQPLGQVPRKLVHQFNLLHRGIGLFVTKDQPINMSSSDSEQPPDQPDLYVHQRTSTKRIFPNLYDMFVGGVSLAKEPSCVTAEREVAEELGLDCGATQLTDKLWTCIVCTAYNRCVVDFFSYTMNCRKEHVAWQEEEVAWGSFVPYHMVTASADLSIQRLAARNEWPGRYPPIQANKDGVDRDAVAQAHLTGDEKDACFSKWDEWDYVPDGLLVWEAWLDWLQTKDC